MVESVREEIQDRIRAQISLDRFASVQEIAGTVRFGTSDEASYITGEIINVNGGMDGLHYTRAVRPIDGEEKEIRGLR